MQLVARKVMPFGKYRGYRFDEIPHNYLQWLLTIDLQPTLHSAIVAELEHRQLNAEILKPGKVISLAAWRRRKKCHVSVTGALT